MTEIILIKNEKSQLEQKVRLMEKNHKNLEERLNSLYDKESQMVKKLLDENSVIYIIFIY